MARYDKIWPDMAICNRISQYMPRYTDMIWLDITICSRIWPDMPISQEIARYGDTPEMAALIAPRPLHLNLGEADGGTPIEHARVGIERIKQAYSDQNASDQFSVFIEPGADHVLSPQMWSHTHSFFRKHLA